MRQQVIDIIRTAISEENRLLTSPVDLGRGDETPLYGDNGQLDSLGLVSLVVAVEHELQTRLGVRLTLVSDRAMSGRRSPFATVSSFADYVLAQLAEAARD